MSKEAMKLALRSIRELVIDESDDAPALQDVRMRKQAAEKALRDALANEALDRMAENARELGLDYGVEQDLRVFAGIDAMRAKGLLKLTAALEQPAQQEPVSCPVCNQVHTILDADESQIIRNAKDGYPDGRTPRLLTLQERVAALCQYASDWKRWCLEKENTTPQAQPAQQEPVGEIGKIVMFGGDLKEVSWKNGKMPPAGSILYTRPQAREPLTNELPALPEGKGVVRGPVAAFSQPECGTLVDFDCEGPLSHDPEDGEELFTADQMREYANAAIKAAHGIK